MSTLKLERVFTAEPERVFAFVTEPEHLLAWWGHEGSTIPDAQLDFSREGPWYSVLMTASGTTHKMSGTVVAVDAPHSVEFTWAWHDEQDTRGHESTVRFEVSPGARGGSVFTLIHSGLADDESAANHESGWTATFVKLERHAQSAR